MGESAIEGDLLCSLPLLLCFCEAVRRRGEQARARASRRREPEAPSRAKTVLSSTVRLVTPLLGCPSS